MNKLKIGDHVMSGDGTFTQVYGFGHLDHNREEYFIQIEMEDRKLDDISSSNLTISPMHLIFIERNHQILTIRAMDVAVGDVLNNKQVISIHHTMHKGVYAPLTQSGDIVVSDIVASNYVDLLHFDYVVSLQHTIGHTLLYPQRCFCYYNIDMCQKEGYIHGYGYIVYSIVTVSTLFRNGLMTMMTTSMMLSFHFLLAMYVIGHKVNYKLFK
jgi:Hint module